MLFPARRAGKLLMRAEGKGEKGGTPAQKHRAVCADRLAKKRTARASGVFTDALIYHQSRASRRCANPWDRKPTAVGLSRPQILESKVWGATIRFSSVE